MSELTRTMGIGSPSLYAAFGSKEELFGEAIDLYCATDGEAIWGATLAAPSSYGAIETFLMTTAREFTREDKPRGCMVILSALHPTDSNASIRALLSARRNQTVRVLAEQLAKGVESGEIPIGVNVEAVARYFIAVQQGMSIQARDGADRRTLESIAQGAIAAWLPLVRANSQASVQPRT